MPELAEVETMRRGFTRHIGKEIETIYVNCTKTLGDITKVSNLTIDQKLLASGRINKSILVSVNRRGKNLIAGFESKQLDTWDAVISPRMTGQLIWNTESGQFNIHNNQTLAPCMVDSWVFHPHTRVGFIFQDGIVEFRDVRQFGHVSFVNSWLELPNLRRVGRDLLDEECDLAYVLARADQHLKKSPQSLVKPFLLDQTQIAGIGNYMAAEILFAAGIRPDRKLAEVSTLDWQRILSFAKSLASLMISVGGVSLRDYNTFDGMPGGGAKLLQVYRKSKCPLEHSVVRVKLAGRTTYFCESCQE